MEAVEGRKRFWLFGKKKTRLIAICVDCWAEMDFVGVLALYDQIFTQFDRGLSGNKSKLLSTSSSFALPSIGIRKKKE